MNELASDDEPVARGEPLELAEDMTRDENRGPALLVEIEEDVAGAGDGDGVQTVGGLVENEQLGVAEDGGGDAERLPHAERVLLDLAVLLARETDSLEGLGNRIAGMSEPDETRADEQVLAGGELLVEGGRLDDAPDVASGVIKLRAAHAEQLD